MGVTDEVPSRRLGTTRATAELVAVVAACALYSAFLLELLLSSRTPGGQRSINLVPFASIASYASSGAGGVAFANVVGNVLIFLPLGFYASWLRGRASAWVALLAVASVSVAVEIAQAVFAIGAADVDDVILNCLGGAIGILAFTLLAAMLRRRSRVRTATAVLSLLSIPVWCFFLFVLRLHL